MGRSKDPLPGCAHWGQVEPSAQLRLSPLGATRLIVGPLPHTQTCSIYSNKLTRLEICLSNISSKLRI